jgi:hypothetical protein
VEGDGGSVAFATDVTDHKTNANFAKELNITPVLDKIQGYKRKWLHHVN